MAIQGLSVVIAARNEAACLPALLADLATASTLVREILVVDGESLDLTAEIAALAGARVMRRSAGRGGQLRDGVAASTGDWLLLLHGDVRLPPGWRQAVAGVIRGGDGAAWAFRLAIAGPHPALRLVESLVNLRCRWWGVPYGDQGLLLSRRSYERSGGIKPLPLMEDLEFALRLRRQVPIRCLDAEIKVNGRRWRRLGIWRTTWINHRLRQAWFRGVSPAELARRYYDA